MPSSMPTAAPTYDSPRPGSAWWIQKSADNVTRSVIATTGYAFVVELQNKLRRYFAAQGHRTLGWEAYTAGRGDVARTTITGLDTMNADGNWGAKTNAGLWIWLEDKWVRAGRPAEIQFLMDQVELIQQQRHLNINALRAAAWLVRYENSPLSYMTSNVALSGTIGSTTSITLPPYNREAPRPSGAEASAFHTWDPDTSPMPPELAGATFTPTPGPGTGPAPSPGPAPAPSAIQPAAVGPKRYLGMTVPQLLLLTGVVVVGGGVAYTMYGKKKTPGHSGAPSRDNPYGAGYGPAGYGAPAGYGEPRDNARHRGHGCRHNPEDGPEGFAGGYGEPRDNEGYSSPYGLPPGYGR